MKKGVKSLLDSYNLDTFYSEAAKDTAAGLLAGGGILIGGILGTYAREQSLGALEEADEESLYINLETLNSLLLEYKKEIF